ncbi:MAG TPA: PSD1 and planctomycete cytochrome C domain-containing protein [Humisphaera sp.]
MAARRTSIFAWAAAVACAVAATAGTARADDRAATDRAATDLFERRIRPALVEHCYKCHSADAAKAGKLKGGLLADTRDGLRKGGDTGPAVVPGKPDESLLIKAIRYADENTQMPPKGKLPPDLIADFERWVAAGAPDPRTGDAPAAAAAKEIDVEAGRRFWSIAPLAVVDPPAVARKDWPRTPIDRFVLARLEKEGIAPNGPAPRERLIRRAYLDLTGLPPTPEEVAAFVADPAADAYEKLIDRLLASDAYGERWGRHWLDVARFGESDGFEHDSFRPAAYQYRDFVIRALNADLPFDRFVKLQLAGDEIAPDDWQAMAATGFLTAGVFPTQITEREFESTRYNQLDDMVGTVGTAMLGLTIGCARCHDHKFDPIGTADYYRLAAAFGRAIRSDVELDSATPADREAARREWEARRADATAKLAAFERDVLPARFAAAVERAKNDPKAATSAAWSVLEPTEVRSAGGATFARQPDGSYLRTGKAPAKDTYTVVARAGGGAVAAIRVEALADKSLPRGGPGSAGNGNFVLSEIEVKAGPADGSTPPAPVKLVAARATHQQNTGSLSVAGSIDGKTTTGWAVDFGGIGKDNAAVFELEKPVRFDAGTVLTVVMRQENGGQHVLGRFRLSVSADRSADAKAAAGPDPVVAETLRRLAAGEAVAKADDAAARAAVAAAQPEYQAAKAALAKVEADGPGVKPTKVQVTSEGLPPVFNHASGRGYPHFYNDVYLLRRGDPNNKAGVVTPAFPRVLVRAGEAESRWLAAPPAGARTTFRRKAVADWITDPEAGAGHLLARVIVNRLWQHHFGRGIVATPNDFGAQGERPTHPELLDWLADDLVKNGWLLKRVHKLMMTSAAYTQSADASPDRLAKDPHGHLLWRWTPRRLEAEPIRDSMLAVAGTLDRTMYGPGSLDPSMARRSIYFRVQRSQLVPMMMVLDWPEPLNSIGARPVTTVAPQALLFLNSPQARGYAEAFAKRIAGPDAVDRGYRTAFGRGPTAAEAELAAAFIKSQTEARKAEGRGDPAAAALADFCQALLSANEFVYVD